MPTTLVCVDSDFEQITELQNRITKDSVFKMTKHEEKDYGHVKRCKGNRKWKAWVPGLRHKTVNNEGAEYLQSI